MTDKEMTILAAKAAGIKGKWGSESFIEQYEGFMPIGWRRAWKPLDNDGDCFELMAALPVKTVMAILVLLDDTLKIEARKRSIRRSIVRAAAEVGNSMP